MLAVLASYATALALKHVAGLGIDVVIQSVVLALSLARTQQGVDLGHRLTSFVAMPILAVGAAQVGVLLATDANIGDGVFLVAVSGLIWIRRFGPTAGRLATMATLPLVSILILQGSPVTASAQDNSWWAGVVALIAAFWVFALQLLAGASGLGPRTSLRAAREVLSRRESTRARGQARIAPTTRMAAQMGVAIGVAFAAGRLIWPSHWTWTVLTAFIVCSGARGRGDVIHKGALRILGAGVGTVLGTVIAGTFAPLDRMSIVVIFAVLAVATWLRPLGYAYWAASVTAVLSLLYGYFGESATGLLHARLEAILLGAVIGIAASWLVLPVRNRDVLRRRLANVLADLSDLLKPGLRDSTTLARQQASFDHSAQQLEQIARAFEAHRRLPGRRPTAPASADAIAAIRRSVAPVHELIRYACRDDDVLASPVVIGVQSAIAANVGAVRRRIAGMPASAHRSLPTPLIGARDDRDAEIIQILTRIDAEVAQLASSLTLPAPTAPAWERRRPCRMGPAAAAGRATRPASSWHGPRIR